MQASRCSARALQHSEPSMSHSEASWSRPDAGQPVQRARSAAGGPAAQAADLDTAGGWEQGCLEKGPSGAGGSTASPHLAAYHQDSCSTGCHQIHQVTELGDGSRVPLQYEQSDQHFDHA